MKLELEKRVFLGKGGSLLFLFLLCFLGSCDRSHPDLLRLKKETYYVACDYDGDAVLYLREVTKDYVSGRWYVGHDGFASPHSFKVEPKRFHRMTWTSDSLKIKFDEFPDGDTLVVELLLDSEWRTLHFVPWQQPSSMELHNDYLYHDSLYKVSVDSDVVYARAKGFWKSYPEPADPDDYLSIVKNKMNDFDMTQRYMDLDMDIYSPDVSDTTRRPLLMLIHGGAFFNGDKASRGYVEWANYFASRGYLVASINYRIGFLPLGRKHVDRAGYRAVQDAHAAMCFLLRHPGKYHIDPNRLFVGGTSAGAITALNLAFMENRHRPESSYEGMLHMASKLPLVGKLIPKRICLEDLGRIEAVAGANDMDFKINAVVNMWGAIHTLRMLDTLTKKSTAILSFHGDADKVVAYDYDYPFNKIKTPARDFIRDLKNSIKDKSSWIAIAITGVLSGAENLLVPLNHYMCNKMYGSKCIHERACELKMKSELHTKKGAGHSLHVEGDELSDYYYLITDTTTRFLYLRMFPQPDLNRKMMGSGQWFEMENAGELSSCQWEAVGGLVLAAEPDKARVLFFTDEDEHGLRIKGVQKNGVDYLGEYDETGTLRSWNE